MSRYDDIRTVYALMTEIRHHGLSTEAEDICRIQDIFGHSSVKTLEDCARNTPDDFYMVLFKIWNYDDACRFWDRISNQYRAATEETLKAVVEQRNDRDKEIESLKCKLEEALNSNKFLITVKETYGNKAAEASMEAEDLRDEVTKLREEITRLKAKLYDMMTAA